MSAMTNGTDGCLVLLLCLSNESDYDKLTRDHLLYHPDKDPKFTNGTINGFDWSTCDTIDLDL